MEANEVIANLDKIIEQRQIEVGRHQMQQAVLQWAVAHKEDLPQWVKDGLIATMEAVHGKA